MREKGPGRSRKRGVAREKKKWPAGHRAAFLGKRREENRQNPKRRDWIESSASDPGAASGLTFWR